MTDVTRPYHSLSHGEIGSTQSPTGGLRRRRRSRSSGGHVSADGSIFNLSSARVRCWTPARHRLPRSSDRGVRRRSPRRGSSPTAVAGHADSAGARHRRNPPRDGTVNAGARIAIVFAAAHLVTSVRQVSFGGPPAGCRRLIGVFRSLHHPGVRIPRPVNLSARAPHTRHRWCLTTLGIRDVSPAPSGSHRKLSLSEVTCTNASGSIGMCRRLRTRRRFEVVCTDLHSDSQSPAQGSRTPARGLRCSAGSRRSGSAAGGAAGADRGSSE